MVFLSMDFVLVIKIFPFLEDANYVRFYKKLMKYVKMNYAEYFFVHSNKSLSRMNQES